MGEKQAGSINDDARHEGDAYQYQDTHGITKTNRPNKEVNRLNMARIN